jgi:hypothetical protein
LEPLSLVAARAVLGIVNLTAVQLIGIGPPIVLLDPTDRRGAPGWILVKAFPVRTKDTRRNKAEHKEEEEDGAFMIVSLRYACRDLLLPEHAKE